MSTITITARAQAVSRAKKALAQLHRHPGTSRQQLGDAREVLNRIYTWNDTEAIRDAVEGIESIVTDVYAGHSELTDLL